MELMNIDPKGILKTLKDKGAQQAEVYISSSKTLKISVLNTKLEASDEISDTGLAIRVIKDKKQGFAYTSDLDGFVIASAIDQAMANAANSQTDEFFTLPHPTKQPIKMNLYDKTINEIPIQKKIELALNIEEQAYKTDIRIKKTEKIAYEENESDIWINNLNGIDVHYRSNACSAYAQVVAEQSQEMEYGASMEAVKHFTNLDPAKIGQKAAKQALELLGAKQIPSQKMACILDPEIGAELLGVLFTPLTAEAVQKGRSLFINKIDQKIGSNVLSIIDNGVLVNGIGTMPFDDEGVATQETRLIDNGILKNYFFNTYTANKQKTRSTGNALRPSFMGLPGTGPTNFYIAPGKEDPKTMLGSIKKGLYITRVMGLHTANPISGDFSLGASGIMIENGEKTYPVSGITIAGNLLDLLRSIQALGQDLTFFGSMGAPSLLISNISISGS